RPVSDWVRTCASSLTAADDTAAAVHAASGPPARVASLILPADAAWGESPAGGVSKLPQRPAPSPAQSIITTIAKLLLSGEYKPESIALVLGGRAMRGPSTRLAGQIAARTGCKLLAETKNARSERG